MNTIPTYQEWRDGLSFNNSYDRYKDLFGVKEYEVFRLDPNTKLSHIEGEAPLLSTDRLDEACAFIYNAFHNEGLELCVWQERSQGYCDYYRKSPKRDRKGRFAKETA